MQVAGGGERKVEVMSRLCPQRKAKDETAGRKTKSPVFSTPWRMHTPVLLCICVVIRPANLCTSLTDMGRSICCTHFHQHRGLNSRWVNVASIAVVLPHTAAICRVTICCFRCSSWRSKQHEPPSSGSRAIELKAIDEEPHPARWVLLVSSAFVVCGSTEYSPRALGAQQTTYLCMYLVSTIKPDVILATGPKKCMQEIYNSKFLHKEPIF